jgi:hypothetical protein
MDTASPEKLPEVVEAGANKDSKSDIQESVGREVGDILTRGGQVREGRHQDKEKKRRSGGLSQAASIITFTD